MNIVIYILIFLSKSFELALGTLRLIVVAHGKKWLGAFLQFAIALVWVIVTGAVVIGITNDPLKVFFFALGSLFGSYLGSVIEEKMAIGDNLLMAITNITFGEIIASKIRKEGYTVTVLNGEGKDINHYILIMIVSRKKRQHIVDLVKNIDNETIIIAENIRAINGGYNL
ncbi:MAG: DUF5698 domain-containing protein [Bacilli bacterium]|nr:DUF5698 domain-containing protein [Bacilli bacterium]